MRIRFLEDTNIRITADSRSAKPLGVLHKGTETEVNPKPVKGERINGNDRWYVDNNGWHYWSGKIEVIELPEVEPSIPPDIPSPQAVQLFYPLFPPIPPGPGNEKIPEGETRRIASFQEPPVINPVASRGLEFLQEVITTDSALASMVQIQAEELSTISETARGLQQAVNIEKLSWAIQKYQIDQNWWQNKGLTGRNIRIAILSTGIAPDHPDLGPIVDSFQYPDPNKPMQDAHSLGTQAAVLCAGKGNRVYGIAPEAQLLIAKIGDQDHTIAPEGLIAGLEWALTMDPDIIAMLVDFPEISAEHTEKMKMLIQRALDSNVLLVAPVGNSEGRRPETRYPSGFEGVFCVGAHDPNHKRCSFSARSYHLDLLAPGEGLLTAGPSGHPLESPQTVAIATAFVSGFLALVCQGLREYGHPIDPSHIFTLLRETATARRSFNPGEDVEFGYGLLDPIAVLKQLEENYFKK